MIGVLESQQLGQAEVGDLHPPALVDQDVFGLDVAMNDAFVVGELQGIADLRHDRQGASLGVIPPACIACRKFTPSTYSMTKKYKPSGLAEIVNRDDVRMVEPRQCAELRA